MQVVELTRQENEVIYDGVFLLSCLAGGMGKSVMSNLICDCPYNLQEVMIRYCRS